MTTIDAARDRLQPVLRRLERAQWLPQLLVRLFVGYFFFETGLGKAQNLGAMADRFADWGIPFPAFSAALSGYTELLGGALIVLGLFTRLISIPLIINMVVAILTVRLKKVSGLNDFVELDEPLYALSFFWLIFSGPGWLSFDHLLEKLTARGRAQAPREVRAAS